MAAFVQNDAGRTASFQSGMTGSTDIATSMEQTPNRAGQPFTPNSVLNAYQIPGFHPNNGKSAADAALVTPNGPIKNQNGMSTSTWQAANPQTRTRMAV